MGKIVNMEYNYQTQYKDRTPKETIKLIETFFNNYDFKLVIDDVHSASDSDDIWVSTIKLYYRDIIILTQRGKGISKDFALASGCAEMYERFCNKTLFCRDSILIKNLQDLNKSKYNYYISSDESVLSETDFFNKYINISNKENIKMNLDYKYVEVPYTNLLGQTSVYYNPWILLARTGTNGMVAGNTLEEALVQGISELFERHSIDYIEKHKTDTYYYIPNNNIKNEHLKSIINSIEDKGNMIRVIDLSYNTNLPVVLVFYVNKNNNRVFASCAAHPVFDIALERCLTEPWQDLTLLNGIDTLWRDSLSMQNVRKEHKLLLQVHEVDNCPGNIFDDSIFINAEEVISYSKIFGADNYNNIELLNYIKDICITNNINIYYRDNSLCKDVFALHIYSPDLASVNNDKVSLRDNTNRIIFGSLENRILNKLIDIQQNTLGNNKQTYCQIYDAINKSIYKDYITDYYNAFRLRLGGYTFDEAKLLMDFNGNTFSLDIWNNCINKLPSIINNIASNIFTDEFIESFLEIYI